MRKSTIFLILCVTLLAACGGFATGGSQEVNVLRSTEPDVLTVYAAASLTDSFTEIGRNFEAAHPGVLVTFNFAGSQTLRTQIEQGARVDVFASANAKEMDALAQGAFVTQNASIIFAANQLVVIRPADNPAGLTRLEDLSGEGLKIVLAAQEVPVGSYAQQVLEKLDSAYGNGFKEKVLANVVSYENDVKQVVAKVQLGEADAGIVYASDAAAVPALGQIAIPADHNVVASYPIAVLTQSSNEVLAQAFVDFVQSPDGQFVLERWGFQPVR